MSRTIKYPPETRLRRRGTGWVCYLGQRQCVCGVKFDVTTDHKNQQFCGLSCPEIRRHVTLKRLETIRAKSQNAVERFMRTITDAQKRDGKLRESVLYAEARRLFSSGLIAGRRRRAA